MAMVQQQYNVSFLKSEMALLFVSSAVAKGGGATFNNSNGVVVVGSDGT
jgi:hypothetical protein